jgi:hypothetical protein
VLIGDSAGDHVLIRPLARSQPGLFDVTDGNWIECELEVAAGGFHGDFRAQLRSDEFQAFLDDLEALIGASEGLASFSTTEGQLALSITGNANEQQLHVHGEAVDTPGSENRLQFALEIDRNSLPGICRSLDHLLAAFPVTEVPGA